MLTENRRQTTRIAYRARLHVFLQIPEDASDQRTHELIELGFPAEAVWGFCDAANLKPKERNPIVTLKALKQGWNEDSALQPMKVTGFTGSRTLRSWPRHSSVTQIKRCVG